MARCSKPRSLRGPIRVDSTKPEPLVVAIRIVGHAADLVARLAKTVAHLVEREQGVATQDEGRNTRSERTRKTCAGVSPKGTSALSAEDRAPRSQEVKFWPEGGPVRIVALIRAA